MNLPAAILVVRLMVIDTFKQSFASAIFWLMLGVTGLATVFCLSLSTEGLPRKPIDEPSMRLPGSEGTEGSRDGVDVIDGKLRILFGAIEVKWQRHLDDAVKWLQLVLAGGVADTVGLLLTLIWTAAFLPTFLEASSVSVLLVKPVPRWTILAGKVIGVLTFVTLQVGLFVVGTWAALGIRTGVWSPEYLVCWPILVAHFAVFFGFSAFLAVWTRSTIACVFGSLLFWMLCWGMNYGRHATKIALSQYADVARVGSGAAEVGYWVLPKPFDWSYLLSKAMGAEKFFPVASEFAAVEKLGAFNGEAAVLSSLAFGVAMIAIAGYEFVKAEY